MASGKITNKNTLSGAISSGNNLKTAAIAGGSGTTDHSRLINRSEPDQHPIEAITDLRAELDSKLNSTTALPLINEALQGKAKGLYFDAMKEFARKSYWYLTAEIDPKTGLGTKDSIISGPYDLGMGGGSGGGGGVTTVTVSQVNWPAAVSVGNLDYPAKVIINWTSTIGEDKSPTGEGTVYLIVNNKQVETRPKQKQGTITFDISRYVVSGDNTIQIKVLDMYGTTGVTVGTITGVSLELKSTFNRDTAWYGKVDFTYTPIGNVTKKVYFIIDGKEEDAPYEIVQSSNELQTYTIYGLSHGAHTLKVYFEADIAGTIIPSNTLFYDIIFVEDGNSTPIIASEFTKFQQEQYISFNIPYRVFIDDRSVATVTLRANGETIRVSEVTTNGTHTWAYRSDIPTIRVSETGEITRLEEPLVLEIICNEVSKVFTIDVVESKITVTPILTNLELALSANGKSNGDQENREIWSYTTTPPPGSIEKPKTYNCTFTNFNWRSDGWVFDKVDETGKPTADSATVLRVSGDARVSIPLELFATNFTAQGKTIELEFATRGIRNYESTIISCLDNDKTPFYTVEPLYVQEEERQDGYEISYIYSILSETITTPGKYLFVFDGTNWTLESKDEAGQTVTTIANLSDYGISLTETRLNKGDRILVNFSMEARGIEVTPQVASIRSQQSFLSTQYKEDEHVRVTFVVEPSDADHNRIIWMYINGVASGAMQYPTGESFQQKSPNYITIGSSEAIVDIYNIRVYNSALTNRQVVNNWIADTSDASLKASRFNHNQVLNEQDQLTPESLFIGAPDLPYMIWDIDPLPEYKGDKRLGRGRYVDPTDSARNFTVEDGEYNVQGTSSAVYPVKNIRLRNRSDNGAGYAWYDDDGNTIETWPITPGGIGVNYYTFKVDYASSEGANNVELTKLYNDASIKYGLLTPPQQKNSNIRVGIDGFPIVAFHQDKNDNITFCTKANFNNDKANEDVYGFANGDESWETTNNSAAETKYQIPVTADNFDRGFEIRFPDKAGYNDMRKLGPMTAWVHSTYREEATKNPITARTFDLTEAVITDTNEAGKTFTYDYESKVDEDGTPYEELVSITFTHDSPDYRLSKFKAELKDWFNVDSCLFYYLFTELFLMIDSRAKNAFPTYFATRTNELVTDRDGNEIPNTYTDGGNRWYWIPYDMDTALGIDNKGKLVFDYYLEDEDKLDGADVYNGQASVMWCNVRDAFRAELAAMYAKLRTDKLISFDEVERRFEEHQRKWPEVVLNLDSHNKYIIPLKNGDNYLGMLQGTKEQQRKWWLYNRFKYIDSKYNAGEAVKDFLQFRTYVDVGQEKPNLEIMPYANIYVTASFGNGARHLVSKRVTNRDDYTLLENTFRTEDDENDQEVYIYSASQLKSIGDISPFHPDTVKIGNAIRLQDLKVGDNGDKYPGYTNPYLKELTVGANTLLKTIDACNCVNLGTGETVAPDLSQCTNIEEIYFTGTKIKGITLPDGGTIKKLHLPGTLLELTIRNQPLLEDLKIENTNTTITRSSAAKDGYTITGIVVKKDRWNETNGNGNLYLADSLEKDAPQIRVSIADKVNIYDLVTAGETKLTVNCTYIDARYDLIDDTEIQLAEYSTRFINNAFITTTAPNVAGVLGAVAEAITPPTLTDFKTSLIETLWLEGIPSKAIKAKEFIKNMLPGTRVRLMNINETYEDTYINGKLVPAWEQVKEFYDLLDRHYGINFNNTAVEPKAQVQGIINIDIIPYKQYIELTSRYLDVVINAKQIISTVTFYNDNQELLDTSINIALETEFNPGSTNKLTIIGKKIQSSRMPTPPPKEPTPAYTYTFTHWEAKKATYEDGNWGYVSSGEDWYPESEYLVIADTRMEAKYTEDVRTYPVIFDTDSDLITVDDDHANLVVKYGSTITKPRPINVPAEVKLDGWYTPQGTRWFFEDEEGVTPTQVLDHIVLKAKWRDENEPSVTLIRQSYNTFRYQATDNLGIVAWAVVKNSTEEPTAWTSVSSTTHLVGIYEIDSEGEYSFWITDANGNKATERINAYAINVVITPGITTSHYHFLEDETVINTTFALSGTTLDLFASHDDHYENLTTEIEPALGDSQDRFVVSQEVIIKLSCTPKDYLITFDLGDKGDSTKAPEQKVTYLEKVSKPLAQYYKPTGEVIDSWYTDPEYTNPWDFETSVVNYHTTLYAKWEAYHLPTILTLEVPDGTASDRTVSLAYSQNSTGNDHINDDHKVLIEWGDGATYSSTEENTNLHPDHTYAMGGTYKVYIYGIGGNTQAWYRLGDGYSHALIVPSHYLTDIEFAWDISELAAYALYGSSLTHPRISEYMSKISIGCYANCKNLEQIEIPENIVEIGDLAFSACSNATGTVKIPKQIEKIGHNAFDGCSSITRFELLCDTTPKLHTNICRNCYSLKEIAISEHLTIPSQMFLSSGLEEVTINNKLDAQAFEQCLSLKKVISNSEYFGQKAFLDCTSLETVVLKNRDLILGSYVFQNCPQLETFGPLTAPIGDNYAYDFNYAWDTEIPAYAFQRDEGSRHNVKSVTLPVTLKKIGALAFQNAVDLKTIDLPAGLEELGEQVFEACSSLSKMTIPGNVTNIGAKVFAGCTALTQVNIKARTSATKVELPENSWFFNTNADATIYVPNDLFEIVKDCYGPYWNFIKVNGTWQEIEYKSYTEPTT